MAHRKTVKIKINSRCKLRPQKAVMKLTGTNRVHWFTDDDKAFALLLPGGVFEGHPQAFAVAVSGEDPAPDPPLKLLAGAPKQEIKNYVYENGTNCAEEAADDGDDGDADDPPDIIIDS